MIPLHPTPNQQHYDYNTLLNFNSNEFATEYGHYVGLPYISFVNSGASAMELALRALKLRRGDKVACNIASDLRVVHTIKRFDATPTFIDSDREYYGIDYDAFATAIEAMKIHTVIIDLPTASTMNAQKLINLAKRHKIRVILYFNIFAYRNLELADYDLAVFSHKDEIAAIGVVTTINKEYHKQVELQKHQSITYDEERGVDVVDVGFEYDALHFAQAYFYNYLSTISTAKDELGFYYHEGLRGNPNITLPPSVDENSIYYFIRLSLHRDKVVSDLYNHQIYTGIGKIPILFFSYYKKKYDLKTVDFPNSIANYNQIITLPFYPSLSFEQVKSIVRIVNEK
jgi:perosamine synthetase